MNIIAKNIWKVFFVIIGLMAFICPVIYWELQSKAYLFKLMFIAPMAVCFFGLFLLWKGHKNEDFQINIVEIMLASFFAWMSFSLLWSFNYIEGLKTMSPWLWALLIILVLGNVLRQEDRLQLLLKIIFISGAGISLLGIHEHFFGNKIFMVAAPPGATFGNRNMAGQYVLQCFPFIVFGMFNTKRVWRYVGIFCGWAMMTYIVLVRSRAGYLGFGAEIFILIVLGFLAWRRSTLKLRLNWKYPLFIAVLMLLSFHTWNSKTKKEAMAPMSFSEKFTDTVAQLQGKGRYGSNERVPTWLNTIEMLKDNPVIGVGVGQWKVEFPHYNNLKGEDVVYNARFALTRLHNDLLEYWATLGTIGLLLLITPVLYTFSLLYKLWRRDNDNDLYVMACFASIVGISFPSMTSFPIQNIVPILFVMIVLEIGVRRAISADLVWKKKFHISKYITWPVGLAFLAVAYPVTIPHYRMVKSNALYFKGDYYKDKHPKKDDVRVKEYVYKLYRESYEQDPTDNIVIMRNIFYASLMGHHDRAIKVGLDSQKWLPYDKMIHQATFEVYWKKQDIRGMKAMADKMMKYSPRYYYTWLAMGHTMWFSGRRTEALDFYEKAFTFEQKLILPKEAVNLINLRKQQRGQNAKKAP